MAEPFVGEIRTFAFGIVPRGWALCNGQLLQINSNQALYSIIGNRYGGDGRVNFALPNLQGRTPIHMSSSYPIATAGGETAHTLTINEMPQHTHQAQGSSVNADNSKAEGNTWAATATTRPIYAASANTTLNAAAIGTTGASQAHNNMQPYTTVSFCIALQGIYPSRS